MKIKFTEVSINFESFLKNRPFVTKNLFFIKNKYPWFKVNFFLLEFQTLQKKKHQLFEM